MNIWTILFAVLIILVGLRFFGFFLAVGFGILRLLIPLAIIGFAVYGFLRYMQDKR